jgi:hypothetical protein
MSLYLPTMPEALRFRHADGLPEPYEMDSEQCRDLAGLLRLLACVVAADGMASSSLNEYRQSWITQAFAWVELLDPLFEASLAATKKARS